MRFVVVCAKSSTRASFHSSRTPMPRRNLFWRGMSASNRNSVLSNQIVSDFETAKNVRLTFNIEVLFNISINFNNKLLRILYMSTKLIKFSYD